MIKFSYADSGQADIRYAIKGQIADPFFLLDDGQKRYIFLDYRELGVFQERNQQIVSPILLDPIKKQAAGMSGDVLSNLAYLILERYGNLLDTIEVPDYFPLSLFTSLQSRGVNLKISSCLYPERRQKKNNEIEIIKHAITATYPAYQFVEKVLRSSDIVDNQIHYQGNILTSEWLKKEVEKIFIDNGLSSDAGIIIAGGPQSSMPHHAGSGPLPANQPIICDFFPVDITSGYHADITRTYVKGKISPELKSVYQAVILAQLAAKKIIKAGILGREVHNEAVKTFKSLGFITNDSNGFIHGTGHGLGLAVHELPLLNEYYDKPLAIGDVVTIEPGLYYSNLGGVRLEDVVEVTLDGYRDLTDYPKELIIL